MLTKRAMICTRSDHPLRRWRKSKGLTLEECGAAVGTSRQVWSDWERGRRRPSGEFMPRVRSFTEGAIVADDFFPSDAAREAA
jgi:transcriptional regulator with XRE-family HTH domain